MNAFPRATVAPQAELPVDEGPSDYQVLVLTALNFRHVGGRRMYEGTVPAAEKARRRAKNRVARRSRRINRG